MMLEEEDVSHRCGLLKNVVLCCSFRILWGLVIKGKPGFNRLELGSSNGSRSK